MIRRRNNSGRLSREKRMLYFYLLPFSSYRCILQYACGFRLGGFFAMLELFRKVSSASLGGKLFIIPSPIQFLGLFFSIGVVVPCSGISVKPERSRSKSQKKQRKTLPSISSVDCRGMSSVSYYSCLYQPFLPLRHLFFIRYIYYIK